MDLNASQLEAVNHITGPCLVLAGPGSGKTTVLTSRIKKLIENNIPANEILVITFTKAAANEMKERFNKLMDRPYPVTFGTFHSIFWNILRQEYNLKSEQILFGNARINLIKEAIRKTGDNQSDGDYLNFISGEISRIKNSSTSYELNVQSPINVSKLKSILEQYENLKSKYKLYDFDDMLTKTLALFKAKPAVLKHWQDRFKYFLIDEMQDMNSLQYELINLLVTGDNNIFGVGDDDQSIYDFRGADPGIMLNFTTQYPNAKIIYLSTNYRSPGNVVTSAAALINHNLTRYDKNIAASHENGKIDIRPFKDASDEADNICQEILSKIKAGQAAQDIAVLYRNHSNARFLVNALISHNIPFYLKEKMPNIYTHWIIKDIEAYFHISIGDATRERMLLILNRPNRFLSRQCLEDGYSFLKIKEFYRCHPSSIKVEELESDIKLIGRMSPYAAINYLRNGVGYENFIKEYAIENNIEPETLLEVLDFYQSTLKGYKTIKEALFKLDEQRLIADYENKNFNLNKEGRIGLYTMHSSKGLEFENVYIIGCNEGIIPSKKALTKEQVEAERRLFYVALTRTKREVTISYTTIKNRDRMYLSRFVNELNVDYSSSSEKASS